MNGKGSLPPIVAEAENGAQPLPWPTLHVFRNEFTTWFTCGPREASSGIVTAASGSARGSVAKANNSPSTRGAQRIDCPVTSGWKPEERDSVN